MRHILPVFAVVVLFGLVDGCSCDNTSTGDGGMDDLAVDAGDDIGVVVPTTDGGCTASGNGCATSGECCSGLCNGTICIQAMCGADNAPCQTATDCCKLSCVGGICSTAQCIADNQPCTAGGAGCCSTECVGGACKPLSTTCKTAGNPCPNGNGDCCSKLCLAGTCAVPSQISYCTQTGDICFNDNECCTGVCTGVTATTAGTCAKIATSCEVDGTICNGCTGCCSSFCAPNGLGTTKICQPASGCHVLGDLCTKTSDCCGGDAPSGLPGAGLVRCIPDPMYPQIGTCGKASPTNCPNNEPTCKNSCQPEGDVCHFLGNGGCSSNSFPNNCCGATGNKGACKLDKLGVPRCYGLGMCVMPGGDCASSSDCCNGVPCLPDAMGHLKCSNVTCVPTNGVCTTTADCCTGLQCIVPPGMLSGTCGVPSPPPPPPPGDGGVIYDLSAPMCALYGQSCSTTVPCCTGATCLSPYPSSAACTTGEADCTCYNPLM